MPAVSHSGRGRKLTSGKRRKPALPSGKRRGLMKRTTKKGAYKKGAKRAFQTRRAPFVETKSKTTEDLVGQFGLHDHTEFFTFNTEAVHINPDVYHAWQQGLGETQIIGQSVYCKYLKRKMTIRWPQPGFINTFNDKAGIIPSKPMSTEVIWGFIPAPLNYTGYTTPTAPNVNMAEINGYINHRVKNYFDERKDKLRFIPKKASTLRILGRKTIRPDLRYMSTAPPATQYDGEVNGTIPDTFMELSWPMSKKLHLEPANDLHSGNPGLFPNYSWLAFCCIFQENWEDIPADQRAQSSVSVAYNDCIWFTDS